MKVLVKKATTDVTVYVFIQNSSVTTGAGLTGLVFNSASLVCYYVRPLGSATALTLATQTVTGAHSDGGFVEVDATNMPGVYRLDLSDAICATGVNSVVVMLKGATNMAPVLLEIQLVSFDPNDAVRAGLAALPNANAEAAGGLYTRGTGAGQINQNANGQIDANAVAISGDSTAADNLETAADGGSFNLGGGGVVAASVTGAVGSVTGAVGSVAAGGITAASIATNAIDADAIAADAVTEIQAGLATSAEVAGVQADTDNIQTRLPAALVSGRMDSSVGAVASGVIAAASFAANALDAVWSTATRVLTAGTNIVLAKGTGVTGFNDITAADVWAAGTRTLTSFGTLVADIWDRATSALTTVGSIGKLLVDRIDAAISSRMATFTYTAPLDAAGTRAAVGLASANLDTQLASLATASSVSSIASDVTAVKAKTDNLPDGIKKNTALANFEFLMVDSTDHVTPKTGLTVTATRSIDGGAFGACANSVTEVASGIYKINLAAADLNGDTITLRFTATGADDRNVFVVTQT